MQACRNTLETHRHTKQRPMPIDLATQATKDACLWPIFVIATVRTYAGVPAWATASVLAGFIRPQYTENIPLNRLLSSIDNDNNEPLIE